MGKPTFKQVLDALKRQVPVGKSYLGVAKGLLNADPVLLDGADRQLTTTIRAYSVHLRLRPCKLRLAWDCPYQKLHLPALNATICTAWRRVFTQLWASDCS